MKHLNTWRLRLQTCCAVLLALACVPASAASQDAANVREYSLPNGMKLIVRPDHRAPTAVHMLWVRVGSMDEVDGTSGVAHVLEHMMFKGTPTVKAGDFSRQVATMKMFSSLSGNASTLGATAANARSNIVLNSLLFVIFSTILFASS